MVVQPLQLTVETVVRHGRWPGFPYLKFEIEDDLMIMTELDSQSLLLLIDGAQLHGQAKAGIAFGFTTFHGAREETKCRWL